MWFWVFYKAPSETEPTNWFAPLIIGIICAWGATVAILIMLQLVRDVRSWISGARAPAVEADRLERSHNLGSLEAQKQERRQLPGR